MSRSPNPPIYPKKYSQLFYNNASQGCFQIRNHTAGDEFLYGNSFVFNLLKPTGYVMHQQFNIQQLYVLPTLYLCVLYLYENKQRLVPLTA